MDKAIEAAARAAAWFHGGQILYRSPDDGEVVTVAGSRNMKWRGGWAHSVEQYAEAHWKEYVQGTEAAIGAYLSALKEDPEVVERVAKAIGIATRAEFTPGNIGNWKVWMPEARAALSAIEVG